ncbi:helix-turn-helix transcriptional regulator [Terrisporobacter sp.]|uniref:helix-turn-helix transcriptional regulator n=1 Tax=Terrisporobacter sp. TaxID=1965305 RepID=UPI00260B75D0|nr:PAS domain-containing protein [Terrisporobacter sp.]
MKEEDKLRYSCLVEFLGKALGSDTEIVLHDIDEDSNSILAIANGHISNRKIGAPITDLALKFIVDKEYEKRDYVCNYTGKSKGDKIIKSSTFFLKDNNKKLIGLLCINQDKSKYLEISKDILNLAKIFDANEEIKNLSNELSPLNLATHTENFADSVSEMTYDILHEFVDLTNIPPERMTQDEKLIIIDKLNQRGVFMLKGAVTEVAKQLHSSEASIYRYLGKINKK